MADHQHGCGQQDGRNLTRRQRQHEVLSPRAFPPSGSDAEDEHSRRNRVTPPREISPYYYTSSRSSRRSGSYSTDSTTRGVDGSIASSPYSDASGRFYHDERPTTHPRQTTGLDNEVSTPLHPGDVLFGAGAWTQNPPHRGQPQPTYGHNGLYHHATQPYTGNTYGLPLTSRRHDYQPNGFSRRSSDDSELSWLDELPVRRRSRERQTAYSDTPRQRYDPPERPEYHESHEYNEHRDRDRPRDRDHYVRQDERRHRHRPRDSH